MQRQGSAEQKAQDAIPLYDQRGKKASVAINGYMSVDYEQLWDLWSQNFPEENLGNLGKHIHFGMDCDYHVGVTRCSRARSLGINTFEFGFPS